MPEYSNDLAADLASLYIRGYQNLSNSNLSDIKAYHEYKENKTSFSLNRQFDMEVLAFLDSQGFCMEINETYILKDLLLAILDALLCASSKEDYERLFADLNNKFSQFYFDVARNTLDIGLKSFHEAIKRAFASANIPNNQDLIHFSDANILLLMTMAIKNNIVPHFADEILRKKKPNIPVC